MRAYGFSTGALALGDFERALDMLGSHATSAVELSSLRDHELPALVKRLPELDLQGFEYVSTHAPSRFESVGEREAARLLSMCIEADGPWSSIPMPSPTRRAGSRLDRSCASKTWIKESRSAARHRS